MYSLFGNVHNKHVDFCTPVRRRNERVKLKVPKGEKPRCKSDSSSPFPDNYFNNRTTKPYKENDENLFVCGRQENRFCASLPRSPLQILNEGYKIPKPRIEKATTSITGCNSGIESILNMPLHTEKLKPVSSRIHYLSSGNSSYIPRNANSSTNGSRSINMSRKFIMFEEKRFPALKENNVMNSLSFNTAQDMNVTGTVKNQQQNVLSAYLSREEENLSNCDSGAYTNFNTYSCGIQNSRSQGKNILSLLNAEDCETLPPTENIGDLFWGEDEEYNEEIIALNDIIRSANIWDAKENYNYPNNHNSPQHLPEFLPDAQLVQEPVLPMDLQPITIEIPWNEI